MVFRERERDWIINLSLEFLRVEGRVERLYINKKGETFMLRFNGAPWKHRLALSISLSNVCYFVRMSLPYVFHRWIIQGHKKQVKLAELFRWFNKSDVACEDQKLLQKENQRVKHPYWSSGLNQKGEQRAQSFAHKNLIQHTIFSFTLSSLNSRKSGMQQSRFYHFKAFLLSDLFS
ncbi:uncharacterized protein LOC112493382 [Ziziphus jujuba]|uniref:Uncharacterized protein LOC112493382 n=1 Tax=Ziziphus jujuba TaxID=326968 RepID=A0ABM3I4V2_ZIZJJ|nr:uncharacterized protein LOC112493382 [Ziziphus jujuba]